MNYEYKTIRFLPNVGRDAMFTPCYEEFSDKYLFACEVSEQGARGWKLVATACDRDGEITEVIMERQKGDKQ